MSRCQQFELILPVKQWRSQFETDVVKKDEWRLFEVPKSVADEIEKTIDTKLKINKNKKLKEIRNERIEPQWQEIGWALKSSSGFENQDSKSKRDLSIIGNSDSYSVRREKSEATLLLGILSENKIINNKLNNQNTENKIIISNNNSKNDDFNDKGSCIVIGSCFNFYKAYSKTNNFNNNMLKSICMSICLTNLITEIKTDPSTLINSFPVYQPGYANLETKEELRSVIAIGPSLKFLTDETGLCMNQTEVIETLKLHNSYVVVPQGRNPKTSEKCSFLLPITNNDVMSFLKIFGPLINPSGIQFSAQDLFNRIHDSSVSFSLPILECGQSLVEKSPANLKTLALLTSGLVWLPSVFLQILNRFADSESSEVLYDLNTVFDNLTSPSLTLETIFQRAFQDIIYSLSLPKLIKIIFSFILSPASGYSCSLSSSSLIDFNYNSENEIGKNNNKSENGLIRQWNKLSEIIKIRDIKTVQIIPSSLFLLAIITLMHSFLRSAKKTTTSSLSPESTEIDSEDPETMLKTIAERFNLSSVDELVSSIWFEAEALTTVVNSVPFSALDFSAPDECAQPVFSYWRNQQAKENDEKRSSRIETLVQLPLDKLKLLSDDDRAVLLFKLCSRWKWSLMSKQFENPNEILKKLNLIRAPIRTLCGHLEFQEQTVDIVSNRGFFLDAAEPDDN